MKLNRRAIAKRFSNELNEIFAKATKQRDEVSEKIAEELLASFSLTPDQKVMEIPLTDLVHDRYFCELASTKSQ
jgi:hypothetical protein